MKLKMMFAIMLLASPSVFAWECPKNPDRFPSLGLNLTGVSEEGDYKSAGLWQDMGTKSSLLVLDTRLPLSNWFTLSIGMGRTRTEVTGEENNLFFGSKTKASGSLFTIGGRIYFTN